MFRCFLWALAAAVQPKALLIADNLCLRQQLVVLQRHKPRPRLGTDVFGAWVQSFSRNSCQVYATKPSSRAILPLAVIPEAARLGDLGESGAGKPSEAR